MSIKVRHEHLGEVLITDACLKMQEKNPDPTSMYVEHDGEIIEVTRRWLNVDLDSYLVCKTLCLEFATVIRQTIAHPNSCSKHIDDICDCGLLQAKDKIKAYSLLE